MTKIEGPTADHLSLKDLGWSAHFQAQLLPEEMESTLSVRVLAVHRDALEVAGPEFQGRVLPLVPNDGEDSAATTGDWLLIDAATHRPVRVLARRSLLKRKGAGKEKRTQLIAANVDTLLLVTSANQDFNPARLERYLALALDAEVMPVVVITKADIAEDVAPYVATARALLLGLVVEAIDARSPDAAIQLAPWVARGQTVALVGSSGVGKSTIVNSLAGASLQHTQSIREDDAKGRHTTSGRSLHRLANGAWLMDTPGMRELQLTDVAAGIAEVFEDVAVLFAACRFNDCTHEHEPGCAVREAVASGALDEARLKRYQKLQREERRNAQGIAEARARSKSFGKMAKRVFADKLKRREW